MKILIAPSKTRNYETRKFDLTEPSYLDEAKYIVEKVNQLSEEEIGKIMKIKGKMLTNVVDEYSNFYNANKVPAILSYTGTVFKELRIDNYNANDINYLKNNVRILSALYGILKPFDNINICRLDMKMKILDISNYKFWNGKIDLFLKEELKKDEVIINLSSSEFSKMVGLNIIDVEFKEEKNGLYKTIGTYSKKARGLLLNYMILNNVRGISDIKMFDLENYKYNSEFSSEIKIVFTRKK